MKKSEYLEALEKMLNDDFCAVTLIANEDTVSIVGNMTWSAFEDVILQIAEDIAERVQEYENIH